MFKNYLLLIFLLCLATSMLGQQNLYRHFTVEDGLPSLTIYQVTQDNLGYIWLATDKGVGKYDGYHFKTFTVHDGLSTNKVRSVFVDNQHRVWLIGTLPRLTYIYNNQVYRLPSINDIEAFDVYPKGIHSYRDEVFIDTEQGLFIYKNDELSVYDFPSDEMEFAGIDPKGVKWFYDDDAVLYPNAEKSKSKPITLPNEEYLDSRMYLSDDGSFYFETLDYFYFYKDSLKAVDFFSSVRLSDHQYPYFTSRGAVEKIDKHFDFSIAYEHFGDFKLQGAFKDNEDNWWFNTLGDGLYLLTANAKYTQTYDVKSGLDDPTVTAITKDQTGSLFIGTENGDLYIIPKGETKPILYPIDNARKIKVLAANSQYIFIGSRQGLQILNRDNFQAPFFGEITELEYVSCMPPTCEIEQRAPNFWLSGGLRNVNDLYLEDNQLLVATNQGVWYIDLNAEDMFIAKRITDIPTQSAVFYNDKIWSGSENGMNTFALPDQVQTIKTSTLKGTNPNLPINTMALDKNNGLWIGTDGFGIYRFSENGLKHINATDKNIVEKIIVDERNHIWAATNDGVKRVLLDDEDAFKVRNYSVGDGLPTQEINTIFSDKQNLYVGTNIGFTVLDKIKFSRNNVSPRVYLTNVAINNRDTILQPNYGLSYRDNNFTIQFVGISYKSNENVKYLYKMEGINDDWQETDLTELSFIGLSPGTYNFHIKAVDVEGRESLVREVTFGIKPPFWQEVWFQVLFVILTILAIYGYFQNRIAAIEKREQEKAQVQQEKAALQLKIAEEEAEIERVNNELAKSKLETLQAQMNPHFAYNALTSIQKFILTKDKRTANKYLVKFARLMRQFLEASKETYISLDKEVKLLQLYIEMEQLRFKDKFQVKYELDPYVDLESIPIPSMLLQVFVENAINHGLVYKEGNGLLTFKIEQANGKVNCIVEDDGIGREKAKAIKKQSAGAYKGLGMKISHERVKYLNMTENVKVHIQIDDEILGQGNGGTRVTVSIEQ